MRPTALRLALPALTAAALAAVTPRAAHAQAPANPLVGHTIPADVSGGLVYLPGHVNGGPAKWFALDTGSRPCIIDTKVAAAAGIRPDGVTTGQGGGGTFHPGVVTRDVALTLDGARLRCPVLWLTDLTAEAGDVAHPIAGILGGSFFHGAIVTIDYAARQVRVTPRTSPPATSPARISIILQNDRPWLRATLTVPGRPPAVRELLIDTGSGDAVDDSLLLESANARGGARTSGLGPGAATTAGVFTRVRIGPYTFRDVMGVVPTVPIVGSAILARFRLVFDYDGGWLEMQPARTTGRAY